MHLDIVLSEWVVDIIDYIIIMHPIHYFPFIVL